MTARQTFVDKGREEGLDAARAEQAAPLADSPPFPLAQCVVASTCLGLGLAAVATAVACSKGNVFGTLVACLAATTCGALIGFVFGFPLSDRSGQAMDPAGTGGTKTRADGAGLAPNTGLEEVSRWLTGVIVGAGLVNLKAFLAWLGHIGKGVDKIANFVPLANQGSMFGAACLVYFAIVGFLSVFSYTRTTFSQVLADSDRSLIQRTMAKLKHQSRETEKKLLDQRQELESARKAILTISDDALQRAQVRERDAPDPAARKRIGKLLEPRLLMALYEPWPKGYEFVLKTAAENEDLLSPRAWLWLACACGQKIMHKEQQATLTNEERHELLQMARAALSEAARDEDTRKHALRLLNLQHGPTDNDLQPFHDDAAIRRSLETAPPAPPTEETPS